MTHYHTPLEEAIAVNARIQLQLKEACLTCDPTPSEAFCEKLLEQQMVLLQQVLDQHEKIIDLIQRGEKA